VKVISLSLALALPVAAHAAPGRPRPEAAAYLEELEKRGLADKGLVTPERLAAEVRAADDELVAEQPAEAAARLYAIVEGPRYQDLSDSEDFQDAEYRLGLALYRGGGAESARRYLGRALARGPKAPFFQAALRTFVDVCLDAHILPGCVGELSKLPADELGDEGTYLRGRALYDADRRDEAEDELKRVSAKSRFYSAALYLRGVMLVKSGKLGPAQDAFCAVADVKDGDTLRFYIDGRYYALRDLSRLALGRVAHEEARYDDAFYHYFLIPSDSQKLGDALFEAAWSSLARRDYHLGARLADEFVKELPRSPRAAEARLLRATLEVKTCRFADAEKGFDTFLRTHEPLLGAIDRALADPVARRALAVKLLALKDTSTALPTEDDLDGRLAQLLDVDARFYRLQAIARGLEKEANDAAHVEAAWRALEARIAGTPVPGVGGELDATTLLERATGELAVEVTRARARLAEVARGPARDEAARALSALEARRAQLVATLQRLLDMQGDASADAPSARGLLPLVRADREHAARLRARVARMSGALERASGELVDGALVGLRGRLEDLLRRARLGKIDAVVGQKRKLERQIEDLAAGRFPPELFGRLHIEGLIGDDEEYWPPEGERWADEYENYK
jgi:hypothetical protein